MTLYPTKATFHLAVAGATMVALGIAARTSAIVAYGAGVVLTLAVGRAIALSLVTRLRSGGFDLKWVAPSRFARAVVGTDLEIEIEIRNRSTSSVRAVNLRALSSSMLETALTPDTVELPGASTTRIRLRIRGERVGRWGIHGFALEVRGSLAGSDGSYEVPLVFHSPFGVELFPRKIGALVRSPRGGRARRMTEAGRPSRLPGEGDEPRELREHVPGDPWKRIAWKASARRGRLLVRETDRAERDVIWLILDARVELWAGLPGYAPLDRSVDEIAAMAARCLSRGDRVGLVVAASRVRARIVPGTGSAQVMKIASALVDASLVMDQDQSDLDEHDIGGMVVEHAQSSHPALAAWLVSGDLDGLARSVEPLLSDAPFRPELPYATTRHGAALRRYLAAFGIGIPPREDGERERTDRTISLVLEGLVRERERPSSVIVWGPAPARKETVSSAVRKLRGRRVTVFWNLPAVERSIGPVRNRPFYGKSRELLVREAMEDAVRIRAEAAKVRAADLLRSMGIVVDPTSRVRSPTREDRP
jgi:uncharacterized protein (DUF58 family)